MALIRWQPFPEMETLRRQMEQIFDEIAVVNREPQITWKPAIELQDTEDAIILRAEIPGVEGKDLDIRVTREAVAISGDRYAQKVERNFRTEFRYGKFQRVIGLPVAVQNDQVQAEFKDGILILTLPKITEARRQVVKVNLADHIVATPEINTAPADANQSQETQPTAPATV